MPEDIRKLFNEWLDLQTDPEHPVEMPQELKDYLEWRKRVIDKAESNGCIIG